MDSLGLGAHSRVRVSVSPNPLHGWGQHDWTLARTGIVQQRCSDWANPTTRGCRGSGGQPVPTPGPWPQGPLGGIPTGIREPRVDAAARPSQVASSWQVLGCGTRCPFNSQSSKGLRKYSGHTKPRRSCASGSGLVPAHPRQGSPWVPHCTWGEGAASPNIPTPQPWSAPKSLISTKTRHPNLFLLGLPVLTR